MEQVERLLYKSFHIDTNRINSRGSLVNMNTLEKWHKDDVIALEVSEVAQTECAKSCDDKRSAKTFGYVYSQTLANTDKEKELLRKIEKILFPTGAKSGNEKNDVEICFNAWKYSAILLTADGASKNQPGGILGRKKELAAIGVGVMSDSEAVDWIKHRIDHRDKLAIDRHEKYGLLLPEWVGKDSPIA